MIIVKKESEQTIPFSQLQEWTGALYRPYLQFSSQRLLRAIAAKSERLKRGGELGAEQLWLGNYFQKEFVEPPMPFVSLRWIDDRMGWGVFAEEPIGSMSFIAEYTGLVRKRKGSDRTNAYCFEYLLTPWLPTRYVIDAQDQGGLSRYINHSEDPNLTSALATHEGIPHVILYAKRPIAKNEELRYDYGIDYWKHRKR